MVYDVFQLGLVGGLGRGIVILMIVLDLDGGRNLFCRTIH